MVLVLLGGADFLYAHHQVQVYEPGSAYSREERDGREERWRRGEVEEKEMVGKRWQGEWRRD